MSLRRGARRSALLTTAIGASALLQGCDARSSHPSRPNVILITLDTTRADHLGCYGHPGGATPNLDDLAAGGVLFEQCTSVAPLTMPAHSSLFSGLYPFEHGVRDNGTFALSEAVTTLAEVLSGEGYFCAGVTSAVVLNREFGLGQGFAEYRDLHTVVAREPARRGVVEINAEETTRHALELLDGAQGRAQPFFLFIHYFDPHEPLIAPARLREQFKNPYLAEIALVDEQLGRLFAALEKQGLRERTLIIVTADHGEGRGEHGELTHAHFVYDSTLAVPLILSRPGQVGAGARIAAQTRVIDVAPTVLDLLGVPGLRGARGVSLRPLLDGAAADMNLAAYGETLAPHFSLGFSPLRALRQQGWKYIHGPRPELYQVGQDRGETRNLAEAEPQRVAEMRQQLRALLEDAGPAPHATAAGASQSQIQALGYVGSGNAAAASGPTDELSLFEASGPHPLDHLDEIDLMNAALPLVQMGRHPQAEQALRALLAKAGERGERFAWVHANLAGALAGQRKLEEALPFFQKALALNPSDSKTQTLYGISLAALGRMDEAIAAYRAALAAPPALSITRRNLALALAGRGQTEEALSQMGQAFEMDGQMAGDPAAIAQLASIQARAKLFGEAAKTLERAITIAKSANQMELAKKLQAQRQKYLEGSP